MPRSRLFRRAVKKSATTVTLTGSDLERGAFFIGVPRRGNKRIAHAARRPEIGSDAHSRTLERLRAREEAHLEASRAYEPITNVFILRSFRMNSLFISHPVSSHAGTNARAFVIKLI